MRERMLTAALSRCAPASRAHAFARSGCLCCAVITVVVVVGSRVVAEEGGCRGGRGGEQQRRDEVAHPVARCDGSVTIQWTARANGPFGRIARLSRLQERQQLRSRRDSDAEPLLPPPRMYVTARSPHAQTGVRAGHQSLCMHALSFFHKSFWLTRIREALEKSAPPPLLSFGSVLRLIPAMSAVPTGAATPGAKDGAVRPRSASPKGGKKVSVSAGMSLYGAATSSPHAQQPRDPRLHTDRAARTCASPRPVCRFRERPSKRPHRVRCSWRLWERRRQGRYAPRPRAHTAHEAMRVSLACI